MSTFSVIHPDIVQLMPVFMADGGWLAILDSKCWILVASVISASLVMHIFQTQSFPMSSAIFWLSSLFAIIWLNVAACL